MSIKRSFCVLAAFIFTFGIANAAETGSPYIIIGKTSSLPASLADSVAANGGVVTRSLPDIGVAFAESSNPKFMNEMANVAGVMDVIPDEVFLYDEPMVEVGPQAGSSTPGAGFFDNLTWGMQAVGAPAAWAAGNTGQGVRVAVLDAGIDAGHPDLAPNINADLSASYVPCFLGPNCEPDGVYEDWRVTPGFYFNHGTHVAGTIAGTGNVGVTGVAPDAELVIVKVCTEYANACFTSSILNGIVHATLAEADLANMSLGGLRRMRNDFVKQCKDSGIPADECAKLAKFNAGAQADYVAQTILIFKRAFEFAHKNGTTIVVANGNNGLNADTSKDIKLAFADFPHTLGISALGPVGWCLDPSTNLDEQAYYTNYGQSVTDFSAPGGNFLGFFLGAPFTDLCSVGLNTRSAYVFDGVFSTIAGGWGWAQGTSMAAPHATGVAALLISANGASMSPQEVELALRATAHDLGKPGKDELHGRGRVHSGY
jgi:subtilisin family serine protease